MKRLVYLFVCLFACGIVYADSCWNHGSSYVSLTHSNKFGEPCNYAGSLPGGLWCNGGLTCHRFDLGGAVPCGPNGSSPCNYETIYALETLSGTAWVPVDYTDTIKQNSCNTTPGCLFGAEIVNGVLIGCKTVAKEYCLSNGKSYTVSFVLYDSDTGTAIDFRMSTFTA